MLCGAQALDEIVLRVCEVVIFEVFDGFPRLGEGFELVGCGDVISEV